MPYGAGTPNTSAGNVGKVLSDGDGAQHGSRFIDSRTRGYAFDSNGRMKGMSNAKHLMLHTLLTVLDSTHVAGFGLREPGGTIGNNFERERETAIRAATSDLVKRGLVEIVSITTNRISRPVYTRVRWRDLTTNSEPEDTDI